MAIINVALSDTFDQWRTKTNTLGTNQGDLANLDAGFAGSDLVSCLNELRSGEDLTQLVLGDSSGVGNNRIKLGDGYEQRFVQGLPANKRLISLRLTFNVSTTDATTIDTFLNARFDDQANFDFTPPHHSSALKFICI